MLQGLRDWETEEIVSWRLETPKKKKIEKKKVWDGVVVCRVDPAIHGKEGRKRGSPSNRAEAVGQGRQKTKRQKGGGGQTA